MKIVSKINVEQIPALKRKGYVVKILPIGVAREIFGEDVFKDAGEHLYVSIDLQTNIEEILYDGVKLVHA
jgi:hypothetical protein